MYVFAIEENKADKHSNDGCGYQQTPKISTGCNEVILRWLQEDDL